MLAKQQNTKFICNLWPQIIKIHLEVVSIRTKTITTRCIWPRIRFRISRHTLIRHTLVVAFQIINKIIRTRKMWTMSAFQTHTSNRRQMQHNIWGLIIIRKRAETKQGLLDLWLGAKIILSEQWTPLLQPLQPSKIISQIRGVRQKDHRFEGKNNFKGMLLKRVKNWLDV